MALTEISKDLTYIWSDATLTLMHLFWFVVITLIAIVLFKEYNEHN
jgi:hypothetical protein